MNKELENILLKVGELYNKYGIKSVTMDDIARELGISKKTLYLYFENKSELVSKVLDFNLEKRNCTFKELYKKDQNAVEELLEVGMHVIKSLQEYNPSTEYDLKKYYPDLYNRLHTVKKEKMYEAVLKNTIKGKKEGLFRADLDNEIISKMQTGRFLNMGADEFFNANDVMKPKYILELFIYHIRGIANSKGLEVLEKTMQKIDIQEYLQ
ncbi:MAG: TetR/AcrR family transcriptional regulator [Bacteroidales bacterium]|jgi:AcrR family transcriptional regulator|nr:TetR/AcrR family transcriptional regulator [Bacteroidales bacterium]